eukprot:12682468-Alexandrium_andersonii.AAC.2
MLLHAVLHPVEVVVVAGEREVAPVGYVPRVATGGLCRATSAPDTTWRVVARAPPRGRPQR